MGRKKKFLIRNGEIYVLYVYCSALCCRIVVSVEAPGALFLIKLVLILLIINLASSTDLSRPLHSFCAEQSE